MQGGEIVARGRTIKIVMQTVKERKYKYCNRRLWKKNVERKESDSNCGYGWKRSGSSRGEENGHSKKSLQENGHSKKKLQAGRNKKKEATVLVSSRVGMGSGFNNQYYVVLIQQWEKHFWGWTFSKTQVTTPLCYKH